MVAPGVEIPITSVDKETYAFIDAQGNRYFEIANDVFVRDGVVEEGAIACHGSGSHGGHIVLKPFYELHDDKWVNLYTGMVCAV